MLCHLIIRDAIYKSTLGQDNDVISGRSEKGRSCYDLLFPKSPVLLFFFSAFCRAFASLASLFANFSVAFLSRWCTIGGGIMEFVGIGGGKRPPPWTLDCGYGVDVGRP